MVNWCISSMHTSLNVLFCKTDWTLVFHSSLRRKSVEENKKIVVSEPRGRWSSDLHSFCRLHSLQIESRWNDLIGLCPGLEFLILKRWSADRDELFLITSVARQVTAPTVCSTTDFQLPAHCTSNIADGVLGTQRITSKRGMASFWKSRDVRVPHRCHCLLCNS